ncbi:hypothetical protein HMPREF0623_1773 [Pediococcus acidilactici DSM 20284]|uniref:Uncharacterized protein n=1 Tax=Pediococcus acidilactici DSM 20284 TaxID=862514 RepID=E0NIE2_PEDAC|nr:hypothetical protein HMPREF0623_1773 [Pediococcus acidilactici DSM 20284]
MKIKIAAYKQRRYNDYGGSKNLLCAAYSVKNGNLPLFILKN